MFGLIIIVSLSWINLKVGDNLKFWGWVWLSCGPCPRPVIWECPHPGDLPYTKVEKKALPRNV
jgi:hypothetical protein